MELKDLVGEHMLSGVDLVRETYESSWGDKEEYDVVKFKLDGTTYSAFEDKADGYRSYCTELTISNEKLQYEFPAQKVIGEMVPDTDSEKCNMIRFNDPITEGTVLIIGTGNTDDYYPYCVIEWHPENLAINQGK